MEQALKHRVHLSQKIIPEHVVTNHVECRPRDGFALGIMRQIEPDFFLQVREIPLYRHVGFEGNKYIGTSKDMAHIGFNEQRAVEDGFIVAPADLAIAEWAETDLRSSQLGQIGLPRYQPFTGYVQPPQLPHVV